MFLYRVKQFALSVTSKMTKDDEDFLKQYLNNEEIILFNKLSVDERKHSVRVARSVKDELALNMCTSKETGLQEDDIIKASLLHDIGKITVRSNPIEKSIIVILDKITSGKLKNMTDNRKVKSYYNHGIIGYEMLKKYGYNEEFLELVRDHHIINSHGNKVLEILKYNDDKY